MKLNEVPFIFAACQYLRFEEGGRCVFGDQAAKSYNEGGVG